MNGALLSEQLARDVKAMVRDYLSQRGFESNQKTRSGQVRRRARHYLTPEAGIPAPVSPLKPSSATCKLLKLNDAGTDLIETSTEETIYSLRAISGSIPIEVETRSGKQFASFPNADPPAAGVAFTIQFVGPLATTDATGTGLIVDSNDDPVFIEGTQITFNNWTKKEGSDGGRGSCYGYYENSNPNSNPLLIDAECLDE